MIFDYVKIYAKAGNGGNGCVSFRREKYVSHGGPDGGDGGRGGDIILRIATGETTLQAYKYHRKFVAENGEDGKGAKFHGRNGKDLILDVPPGTVVKEASTGRVIVDMSDREPFVLCKGGKGGFGNTHFSTPTRQVPMFAKAGMEGKEIEVIFELKMLADVGLIGLPNAGKSLILSKISAAQPKIANYPFTTLSPNLGVVSCDDKAFVAADIPGLIEGASEGNGLGHEFLRHVERCRLFVHVVDASEDDVTCDPVKNIELINEELRLYNEELVSRPQIIAANKCDTGLEDTSAIRAYAEEHGYGFIEMSAYTGKNVRELVSMVAGMLAVLPLPTRFEADYTYVETLTEDKLTVRRENDTFYVESEWLKRMVKSVNFDSYDALLYFHRLLRERGVIAALEEKGACDGKTVDIYGFEFEFVK